MSLCFAQGRGAYIVMTQHHPFGVPRGARGVDEERALVGLLAQDDTIQLHDGDGIPQLHEVMPLWRGRWLEPGDRLVLLRPHPAGLPQGMWPAGREEGPRAVGAPRKAQDFHTQPPSRGLPAQTDLGYGTGTLALSGLSQEELTGCAVALVS